MIELRANLLTETGRPKKLLIPPSTVKLCPIKFDLPFHMQQMRLETYIARNLAARCIFYIQTCPSGVYPGTEPLILYNGGWENQWIEHEEHVANIYEFRE